jgi:hypothetical protein
MRDLDAPLLGDQPESAWELGLDALAGLQQEWLGRTGDLLAAGAELRPLRQLALVAGALYQAHTYSQLIPTVMPDDLADLRDGDVQWLQRALDCLNHGIQGAC